MKPSQADYAQQFALTLEDLASLKRAALATWQVIAYDCLEATGSNMKQDEVIEVVLDADYIVSNHPKMLTPAAKQFLLQRASEHYPQLCRYMADYVFTVSRYGM